MGLLGSSTVTVDMLGRTYFWFSRVSNVDQCLLFGTPATELG